MHDLLQEMGREIVRRESPNKIGNRSRLWRHKDVRDTLKHDDGTYTVQGIVLDLLKIKDIHLSPQAFKKMYNLRFLKFYFGDSPTYELKEQFWKCVYSGARPYNYKVHFPNGMNDFSEKLRSLIWLGYPLTALPSDFHPENLVELDMRDKNLEGLWKNTMDAPNLKWLILDDCTRLTKIPDLSDSPLLRVIDLKDCRSLLDFPQLAQHLKYLHYLDLRGCKSLRSFPSNIHFESLTSLDLHDCNNITKFPEISGNITHLDLSGTAIEEVPPSIQSLTKLLRLNLSQCTRLKHICKLESLVELNLENCFRLKICPEILDTVNLLEILNLSGTAIKELPHSIAHLDVLGELHLRECTNLEMLPSGICNLISRVYLDLTDCPKLEMLPENLGNLWSLKDLLLDRTSISPLPSTMIHLDGLVKLSCRGCRGLRFSSSSGLPCSLKYLYLSDCNLKEIPEDIGSLSSLFQLHLSGNDLRVYQKA
ncbi:hypothetical protein Ddye_029418 [Dipteronia dyeriana]|uniref:Uncharacterized protein n=1 Tax=Dipteronia dyeriana TaxID=168575 RepID=A0AAD9TF54_9ROSI|nr:hypothetical protein Ddye_029418 [Dipteronia dyeriana]